MRDSILFMIFFLLEIGDFYTTWKGLRMGFGESNPIMKVVLKWGVMTSALIMMIVVFIVGVVVLSDSLYMAWYSWATLLSIKSIPLINNIIVLRRGK